MICRAGLLTLAMLFGSIGGALAHALPGSVLLLRQQGDELQLTIQFPLEDLIIAAPELAALEAELPGHPLPREIADRLALYIGRHLSVSANDVPLALTMTDARVQSAYHDHVGHFALIVSQWQITDAGADPASLLLVYDAVMHEVRNHRAMVLWRGPDGNTRRVSDFGFFSAADGVALEIGTVSQD